MATTINYNIPLYDSTIDGDKFFSNFLDDITGVSSGSALNIIDSTMKTHADLISSTAQDLQNALESKASFKSGSGTFPAGTTHTVTDAFITAATLVTISPTAEKQGVWAVDSTEGSFTITSDMEEPVAVTFDWGAVK